MNEQLKVGTVKRAGQQRGPRSFLPAVSKPISMGIAAQVGNSNVKTVFSDICLHKLQPG